MKFRIKAPREAVLAFLAGHTQSSSPAGLDGSDLERNFPKEVEGVFLTTPIDAERSKPPSEPFWIPGYQWNQFDVVPWVMYDRIDLSRGVRKPETFTLFEKLRHHTVETPGRVRTTVKYTNMQVAGQLPSPDHMLVQRMYVLVSPDSHAGDVSMFLRTHSYDFIVGQKTFGRGMCLGIARVGLLEDVCMTLDDQKNKWAAFHNEIGRRHESPNEDFGLDFFKQGYLTLWPQQNFRVDVRPYEAEGYHIPESSSVMWFCLDGLLARGVQ